MIGEIHEQLASTAEAGLGAAQVALSRQHFGSNRLTPLPREPLWKKFIEKFDEPIIKILLAAALLSMIVDLFKPPFETGRFLVGGIALGLIVLAVLACYVLRRREWVPSLLFLSALLLFPIGLAAGHASYDGLAVMIAVILATGVAFASEFKSDREFEILNAQKESLRAKVMRDGAFQTVPLEEVVVGDCVILEMGDEIPADGRLLKATELYVDQSLMTGESEPVRKQARPADDAADGPEQPGCLYRGTQIVDGVGEMLVMEVGDATALGQIARRLSAEVDLDDGGAGTEQQRVKRKLSVSKELTPLQQKLEYLAGLISKVGYVAAAAIFVALLVRGILSGDVRWPSDEPRALSLGRHGSPVDVLAFSPDGKILASAAWTVVGEDLVGEIKLWNADTGNELRTLHGHGDIITSLAFSRDSNLLASAGKDATICVWDVGTGQRRQFVVGPPVELKPDHGHNKDVNRLAFSPDGTRLASASSDGTAKVWDVATGKVLFTFTGHRGEVFGIAFSPDGSLVASCGEDRRIRLWHTTTGEEKEFEESFWEQVDVKNKIQRKEMRPGIRNPEEDPVLEVVFSPDGKRLATSTFGKKGQHGDWWVRAWNVQTGQPENALRGTGADGLFMAFADNDRLLVAVPGHGVTRWDTVTGVAVRGLDARPATGLLVFTADGQRRAWTEGERVRIVIGPDNAGAVLLETGSRLLSYFMYMVIIIVVAVPEGLPMSVTVSLALAMRKMTRSNSLVRQLVACETVGSTTVICSDKTGTLTQNKMQVARLSWLSSGAVAPEAQMHEERAGSVSDGVDLPSLTLPAGHFPVPATPLEWIALNAAVNSTANLEAKSGPYGAALVPVGNSTEGALLLWLHEHGIEYQQLRLQYEPHYQVHFSSDRKRMTTVIRQGERLVALVKGAPEWVLAQSTHYLARDGQVHPWSDAGRAAVEDAVGQTAAQAMRTLAFGYAILPPATPHDEDALHELRDSLESELIYAGFVAIRDPLREDVKDALNECRRAGIEVKMITGDNVETARAIGAEIGLLERNDAAILTSAEFNALDDEQLKKRLSRLRIVARARPLDKFRMVRLLQEQGEVVAVTGDGTNDAPALKRADVGLSMGRAGTAVAKEASKIVLLDDAFSTIVKAVHWGRALYENIQRFLQFQLTINVSALVIAFLGPLVGIRPPFTILQLLWINVIMDTLAAIALCSEPPRPGLMSLPPKRRDESILTGPMLWNIFTTAAFFVVVMMGLLLVMKHGRWFAGDSQMSLEFEGFTVRQVSIFFSVYVFFQVWNEINCRSLVPEVSGFHGLFGNPMFLAIVGLIVAVQIVIVTVGGAIFHVEPLGVLDWLAIAAFTATVLGYAELARQIRLSLRRA